MIKPIAQRTRKNTKLATPISKRTRSTTMKPRITESVPTMHQGIRTEPKKPQDCQALKQRGTKRRTETVMQRTNMRRRIMNASNRQRFIERALKAAVRAINDDEEVVTPMNVQEARNSPQWRHWKLAMDDALKSMFDNNVWDQTDTKVPDGRKSVSSKWVFARKHDHHGKIMRYKARLVARGFSQVEGVDYTKTFAPVLQQEMLRSLLAIASNENWEIDQIDIKTAFLYGPLDEEIYLQIPDGRTKRLNKAIYGLKQAGRQWYGRFL